MKYGLTIFLKSNFLGMLFFITGQTGAQRFAEEEYQVRNGARKLEIRQQLTGSNTKKQTLVYFDRAGRVAFYGERYWSAYDSGRWYYQEFHYDKKETEPYIIVRYHKGDSVMAATVKQRGAAGLETIDAEISASGSSSLVLRTKTGDVLVERCFSGRNTNLEPYSSKYRRPLKPETIPQVFVPADWQGTVISGYDVQDTSYEVQNKLAHRVEYTLTRGAEKIELGYNASDAYDAGKGVWTRYNGKQEVQELFIYGGNEISPFGTQWFYDAGGRPVKKVYGYFDKIPQDNYLNKQLFFYNKQGDRVREERYSESKKKSTIKYLYRYDQKDNWTELRSVYDDFSGSTITRRIWYGTEPDYKDPVFRGTEGVIQQFQQQAAASVIKAEEAYRSFQDRARKQPAVAYFSKQGASENWKDFLPAHMVLDTVTRGDLNKDGLDDLVIVYQPEKLLERFRNTERIARILFKQADGSFRLAAESKKAIAPEAAHNVYFSGIEIKKGILVLQMDFLRGGCTYKYRYQDGGFYLIGCSYTSSEASYTASIDYNLSTGDYIKETSQYEPAETTTSKKGRHKLRTLPNFETHELGSLEVDDMVF
ncbi:hypothetical protein LL912_07570 [Niabella sp. CC-SYL272]|uniref:hypothetical protein n=1 Tax=Niabella agricola TaxID=2891571 RepID=UPI001F255A15|nr:hypothetical protein [Niabella agricola]MCF3108633.1 hypothetical protein [Niabella agricola]